MKLAALGMATTRDHFGMNPWSTGERRLAFHLSLDAAPRVGEAATRVHSALSQVSAGRPVPVPWLHLTMSGFGRVDEVAPEAVDEIRDRVFSQWERFADEVICYDQLLVADESVVFTGRDDDWLQELSAVQEQAIDAVLGGRHPRRLWPHTSLVYTTGEVDTEGLRSLLVDVASELPDAIEAHPTLTLMELGRDTGNYEWTVIRAAGPRG